MSLSESGEVGELLLIVDDEPLMTELFKISISKRGFRVITANDGLTALEMVSQHTHDVRLIITDMTMPSMDGVELASALIEVAPTVPVLIATGHDTDFNNLQAPPNVVGIVNKPYKTNAMVEAIRKILDMQDLP